MIPLTHGAESGHETELDVADWRRIESEFAQSLARSIGCAAKVA